MAVPGGTRFSESSDNFYQYCMAAKCYKKTGINKLKRYKEGVLFLVYQRAKYD